MGLENQLNITNQVDLVIANSKRMSCNHERYEFSGKAVGLGGGGVEAVCKSGIISD